MKLKCIFFFRFSFIKDSQSFPLGVHLVHIKNKKDCTSNTCDGLNNNLNSKNKKCSVCQPKLPDG